LSDSETNAVAFSKDLMYGFAIVLLAALLAVSVLTQGFGIVNPAVPAGDGTNGTQENKLADTVLKSKLETYITDNLLADGYSVEVTKLEAFDNHLMLATLNIKQGSTVLQEAQAYISNDGSSLFIGEALRLNETLPKDDGAGDGSGTAGTANTTVKVERPKAEAFVMSFCPYGLQFLKAYVPVIELLGDKADLEIRFVSYAMHGKKEIDGNSYIYCVQKEQKPKLPAYLRCFLESGNYTACGATAGLDTAKLDACVVQLDAQYNLTGLFNDQSAWAGGQYPPYPVESGLNDQYGVRGSPTFVLNGKSLSVGRSAEAVKTAICASFINPPAECNTTLRSESEAAGLGAVASGTSTGSASCG